MDESRLNDLMGRMLGDMGAAASAPLVLVGDKLGLYKALAGGGPMTAEGLAEATGTSRRYVEEWCAAQAASGYIDYDVDAECFRMSPEQAAVFADDASPVNMMGGFQSIGSLFRDEDTIAAAFQSGRGVAWGEHHPSLFSGTARFFGPGYRTHLLSSWIPALDGVEQKLERGARVADVGCGFGVSTSLLAERFPESSFVGFDVHPASVEEANARAEREGLANVEFRVGTAKDFPGTGWDLVACFDCLHDMGDPAGAAGHIYRSLAPDGTFMIVEPLAGDRLADNLNPVGRLFYCFSTMVCTPASVSQEVGAALGAQAGEARLREIATSAGFTRFRRATETPFNMVLEARP